MEIINRGNVFTGEQIEKVIRFLGKDYKPRRIIVYETRLDMFKYFFRCFNFSIEELLGKLEGSYNEETDK